MARSFNQVIIVGNLARDPELRNTQSGQAVASFAVATNRVWTDAQGQQQEQADFHNVVAWGKLAELADQYLGKGRRVMIVGRLQTRSWEGEDGKKNYKTEIVANEVNFLDGPSEGGTDSGERSAGKPSPKKEDVKIENVDDDVDLSEIPF